MYLEQKFEVELMINKYTAQPAKERTRYLTVARQMCRGKKYSMYFYSHN